MQKLPANPTLRSRKKEEKKRYRRSCEAMKAQERSMGNKGIGELPPIVELGALGGVTGPLTLCKR